MSRQGRHVTPAVVLAVVVLVCARSVATETTRPNGCELTDVEVHWIQRALDGWDLVRRDFLKVDARPLPWIVLFDAACAWHLAPANLKWLADARPVAASLTFAGAAVDVRALRHSGTVLLPNHVEIPIELKASTALYQNGRSTFLVMAMPSVWRSSRYYARSTFLDDYLQGAFSHELTHTRHLVPINRRLRQIVGSGAVPDRLTDDVVQERFHREPGFARAVKRERDMFFRAALVSDPVARRDLAKKALGMVKERHARYFTGDNAAYAEIESLFLTMEGSGQWSAYRLTKSRAVFGASDAEALRLVRDNRRYWSQDIGLAIFLLLDQLMPDWQARIFQASPASPFALIEEALQGTDPNRGP